LLSAKAVGVVQLAVGGMHCAALTHDNKILTWGVNDQGALGRETKQEGKMKDISNEDSDSDSDDDGEGLNPSEAEPRAIDPDHFPEGTKFAQLIASDSATFVVTDTGLVYGWGTFRVSSYFLQRPQLILTHIGQ
jgi:regulator of chromosome condensation